MVYRDCEHVRLDVSSEVHALIRITRRGLVGNTPGEVREILERLRQRGGEQAVKAVQAAVRQALWTSARLPAGRRGRRPRWRCCWGRWWEQAFSKIEIEYCRQCRWLLRTAWMAQELLTTFEGELGGVTLVPGTGGVFVVRIEGEIVWSRKDEGRFPDIGELKQRVRDRVAPEKSLGHADRPRSPTPEQT